VFDIYISILHPIPTFYTCTYVLAPIFSMLCICGTTLQMAGLVPTHIRIAPGQRLWSTLEIQYHDEDEEDGSWRIDGTTDTLIYTGSVTYIYRSHGMYDAFFTAPVQITQRVPFHRIWDSHRHVHEPAPENLGRRRVVGDARTYRRLFGQVYRGRGRGRGRGQVSRDHRASTEDSSTSSYHPSDP
jgi:hypothetical protein